MGERLFDVRINTPNGETEVVRIRPQRSSINKATAWVASVEILENREIVSYQEFHITGLEVDPDAN